MGTTADKIAHLNSTKTAIKNAITAKGVAVPEGTTFREYADKIGDISAQDDYELVTVTNTIGRNICYVTLFNGIPLGARSSDRTLQVVKGTAFLLQSTSMVSETGAVKYIGMSDVGYPIYQVNGPGGVSAGGN